MLRDKLYVPSVMVKYKCSKFYLRSVLFSEVSHLSCSCFLSLVAMVNTRGACVEGTTKEDSHILLFTSAFMLLFPSIHVAATIFSKVLHSLFLRVLVSCLECSYACSQRMSKDRNALPSIPVSVQLVARPRSPPAAAATAHSFLVVACNSNDPVMWLALQAIPTYTGSSRQ